mmetsp:Transcript_6288/g.16766  ORF Transcript_6288/g.16766 Transcript_6288/m.16766 type:complete len:1129 (+) Transcript_6288:3-3389(+)
MECPVCLENYDTSQRAPMISTTCMHSVCLQCSETLKRGRAMCPTCRANLGQFVKNFSAIEALALIEAAKRSTSASSAASDRASSAHAQLSRAVQPPQMSAGRPPSSPSVQSVSAERLSFRMSTESELGFGAFARVYHGYLDASTPVAIKVAASNNAAAAAHLRQEAQMLALAHAQQPCSGTLFLQLHGLCERRVQQSQSSPAQLYIVTELMGGGSLQNVLREFEVAKMFLPGKTVLQLAYQIAQALAALHTAQTPLAHRDVKPGNVLLQQPIFPGAPQTAVLAKLADFGLAKLTSSDAADNIERREGIGSGSLAYLAPEVLAPEDFPSNGSYDERHGDVYSFGVLLWELVSGQEAWASVSAGNRAAGAARGAALLAEMYGRVVARSERPGNPHTALHLRSAAVETRIPEQLATLIDLCWVRDPRRRPSMSHVADLLRAMLLDMAPEHRSAVAASAGLRSTNASVMGRLDSMEANSAPALRMATTQESTSNYSRAQSARANLENTRESGLSELQNTPSARALQSGFSAISLGGGTASAGRTGAQRRSISDSQYSVLVERLFASEDVDSESWTDLLLLLSSPQCYSSSSGATSYSVRAGVVERALRNLGKVLSVGESTMQSMPRASSTLSEGARRGTTQDSVKVARANGALELLFDRVMVEREGSAAAMAYGLYCAVLLLQYDIELVDKQLSKPEKLERKRLGEQPMEIDCFSPSLALLCSGASTGGDMQESPFERGLIVCENLARILIRHAGDSYIQSHCVKLIQRLQYAGGKPWNRAIARSALPNAVLRVVTTSQTELSASTESDLGRMLTALADSMRIAPELAANLAASNAIPWLIRFASSLSFSEIYSGARALSSDATLPGHENEDVKRLMFRRRAALEALSICALQGGTDAIKRVCAVDGALKTLISAVNLLSTNHASRPAPYLNAAQSGVALAMLDVTVSYITRHAPTSAAKYALLPLVQPCAQSATRESSEVATLLSRETLEKGMDLRLGRLKNFDGGSLSSQSETRIWITLRATLGCDDAQLFGRLSGAAVDLVSLMAQCSLLPFHHACCELLLQVARTPVGGAELNRANAEFTLKKVSLKLAKASAKKEPGAAGELKEIVTRVINELSRARSQENRQRLRR